MRIDMHLHTFPYSPCSSMTPDELLESAIREGLDGICLTEHNMIWPWDEAQSLATRYGIRIFRGVEVTTTGGDILVFGLENVPMELVTPGVLKTHVDENGGIAIAAHPFRGFLLFGFGKLRMNLKDAADNPTFSQVHGLEVCNGMVTADENEFAGLVADHLGLIKVGGSDAHTVGSVGTCVTCFEENINDERELVQALKSGKFYLERRK